MIDDDRWSAEADAATREAFSTGEPGMPGWPLHCKHVAGRFGTVQVAGAAKPDIEVVQKSGGTITFRSVEEFIRAGWTID
jgi:hypothetical protein